MIRKAVIVMLVLLAVATGLAWVAQPESLALVDMQETEAARLESHWVLFLDPGGLIVEYGPYTWRTPPRQYFSPRFVGFRYAHHKTANQEYRALRIPYWALFLLFIAYPILTSIRGPVRRWRRRRKGLCVKCGYNLTGLPEPRCPECGEVV